MRDAGAAGPAAEIIGALIAHLARAGRRLGWPRRTCAQGDFLTLLKRFEAADRALSTALRVSREQGDAGLERNTLRSIGLLRWHEGRQRRGAGADEHALCDRP